MSDEGEGKQQHEVHADDDDGDNDNDDDNDMLMLLLMGFILFCSCSCRRCRCWRRPSAAHETLTGRTPNGASALSRSRWLRAGVGAMSWSAVHLRARSEKVMGVRS